MTTSWEPRGFDPPPAIEPDDWDEPPRHDKEKRMRLFKRGRLHAHLGAFCDRLIAEGGLTPQQIEAAKFVRGRADATDVLESQVDGLAYGLGVRHGDAILDPAPPAPPTPGPAPLHPILNWMWEHRQEILAFIVQIFGMFAK